MPWNEPGDNKDPWKKKSNSQGPPDLDELLSNLTRRFGGLFGGGGGSGGGGNSLGSTGIYIILGVILAGWLLSGIYIVDEGYQGLVLRFGKYTQTTSPGPHWHLPYPIESVETVDISQVRGAEHQATMLTQDENIVAIDLAVQYDVSNARNYAFEAVDPNGMLELATESAVREVVGNSKMDFVLGAGRAAVSSDTRDLIQRMMDTYKTGLHVITVNLQQAQPPEPVQGAYEDTVKAREDRVRFQNQAQAYANGILPKARGEAARIEQDAIAYKDKVTARAQGNASRFSQLLTEYHKAPQITRDRLYIEALEQVLGNSSKVMMDVEDNNNLLYLPLNQLMQQGAGSGGSSASGGLPDLSASGGDSTGGRSSSSASHRQGR